MTSRDHYYVSGTTAEVSTTLWNVALEHLRPQLYLAIIDFLPDLTDKEPDVEFREEDIATHNFLRSVSVPTNSRRRPHPDG